MALSLLRPLNTG